MPIRPQSGSRRTVVFVRIDAGQVQQTDSVGYFCEGTYYTRSGGDRRRTRLLRMAGASGARFMRRLQLLDGIGALRQRGKFRDGVYNWYDDNGKKHNQDRYDAGWKSVMRKKVRYPKPQFDRSILFWPESFDLLPIPDSPGIVLRAVGRFQ